MANPPMPSEGFVLTHFIVSDDVPRSAAFYSDVLGGEVVWEGEPTIVRRAPSSSPRRSSARPRFAAICATRTAT